MTQPYQPSPQKLDLARQITQLETDLRRCESDLRTAERQLEKAKSSRTGGAVGMLISLIGMVLLLGLWPLWALIFLAGVLALVTAGVRQGTARRERQRLEQLASTIHGTLSQARMQFGMTP